MDKDDNPYKILGVSPDADEIEIKNAYRKAARQYHPDKLADASEEDRQRATDFFVKLSDAYNTLTDPVRRYDWKQANCNKIDNKAASSKQQTRTSGHRKNSFNNENKVNKRPSRSVSPKRASNDAGKRRASLSPGRLSKSRVIRQRQSPNNPNSPSSSWSPGSPGTKRMTKGMSPFSSPGTPGNKFNSPPGQRRMAKGMSQRLAAPFSSPGTPRKNTFQQNFSSPQQPLKRRTTPGSCPSALNRISSPGRKSMQSSGHQQNATFGVSSPRGSGSSFNGERRGRRVSVSPSPGPGRKSKRVQPRRSVSPFRTSGEAEDYDELQKQVRDLKNQMRRMQMQMGTSEVAHRGPGRNSGGGSRTDGRGRSPKRSMKPKSSPQGLEQFSLKGIGKVVRKSISPTPKKKPNSYSHQPRRNMDKSPTLSESKLDVDGDGDGPKRKMTLGGRITSIFPKTRKSKEEKDNNKKNLKKDKRKSKKEKKKKKQVLSKTPKKTPSKKGPLSRLSFRSNPSSISEDINNKESQGGDSEHNSEVPTEKAIDQSSL